MNDLSEQELIVLELMATGASNKVIARQLSLSVKSTESTVFRIMRKMDAPNRTAAACKFVEQRAVLKSPAHDEAFQFAGWFKEVRSGMAYRLWDQGGYEQQPGDVALYERR